MCARGCGWNVGGMLTGCVASDECLVVVVVVVSTGPLKADRNVSNTLRKSKC
jgi:hypothetical protein